MPILRIEFDRGAGWELATEGDIGADIRVDQIAASLQSYANETKWPHRAFLDGKLVAIVHPAVK